MTTRLLIKIHFFLLLVIVLNFFVVKSLNVGLHVNIIFIAKILFWILGIVLFFLAIKNKKKIYLYFSIYLFYPIITLISWAIDGILGAVLASILLLLLTVPDPVFKDKDYIIYKKFKGFISPYCGSYEIRENVFLIFQRGTGEIAFDSKHSFESFDEKDGKKYLKVKQTIYDQGNQQDRDTTIMMNIK